jgi:Glucose / Sorbosone dehydrogenase
MRHPVRIAILLACLALLAPGAAARAATLVPVASFDAPIYVTSDPSDPGRLLVAERRGRVVLVDGPTRAVIANLETWVQCCKPSGEFEGERGLLSIAPAPDFATSGRFYAAYIGKGATAGGATGDIHVDAFTRVVDGGAPLREPLLTVPHATFANHNGGQLQWGRDGQLYLSTGDGGGSGDPDGNAQDPTSPLGKILRIDPADGSSEVWASGLRNPWRFSFDRLTGTMVIGDVGQELREEVDIGMQGANYGWNCREGFIAYPGAPAACDGLVGAADPIFDYPHQDPGDGGAFGCSITGGYVVRDPDVPELYGRYLYADFCQGRLRSLVLPPSSTGLGSDDRATGMAAPDPVSFGEDAAGRIYVVSGEGTVYRLVDEPVAAPAPPPQVAPRIRPLVVLQARKRGRHTVKLVVRVLPCGERAGHLVYIKRNGRPFRQRRLGHGCVTRLRVRVRGRTRFRAFFEDQRSQVRTIAFAKPRP